MERWCFCCLCCIGWWEYWELILVGCLRKWMVKSRWFFVRVNGFWLCLICCDVVKGFCLNGLYFICWVIFCSVIFIILKRVVKVLDLFSMLVRKWVMFLLVGLNLLLMEKVLIFLLVIVLFLILSCFIIIEILVRSVLVFFGWIFYWYFNIVFKLVVWMESESGIIFI